MHSMVHIGAIFPILSLSKQTIVRSRTLERNRRSVDFSILSRRNYVHSGCGHGSNSENQGFTPYDSNFSGPESRQSLQTGQTQRKFAEFW